MVFLDGVRRPSDETASASSAPSPDQACISCRFYTMYSRTCALTWGKMEAFDSCSSCVWNDDKERYGKRARDRTDG